MIVMKFGGSSVESAKAIQRIAGIVRGCVEQQPVVVVSAMGKTTDSLLKIARLDAAGNWQAAGRELARLRQFHMTEAAHLARGADAIRLDRNVSELFDELEQALREVAESGRLTPRLSDSIASFGERLSSLIVTVGLRQAGIDAVHLDARTVIVTDSRHGEAAPLFIETNAMLRRKVSSEHVTVMGGFIGATEDGVTTTLGRGGSDYTAAIAGAALGADEIQIWTDVDGMLTCDPRVVPNAHCLRTISFAEAELMAKAGAKVLHPATVVPAVRQRIPIMIRNSRNPGAKGTRIVGESARDGVVMSIACRTGLSLLRLMPRNTPVTAELGQEIWDVFEKAGLQLDLVSMSEREMSLVVETASLTPEFRERLNGVAEVEAVEDRAILTLVGHNAARNPSNLARASQRLCRTLSGAQAGAILYCGCDSRFAFVLDSQALSSAAAALHEEFFAQPNPVLFVPNRVSINVVEAKATACALVSANQVS